MISKQVLAFVAGVVVVSVAISAFVIYDNNHGDEYTSDGGSASSDHLFWKDVASNLSQKGGKLHYGHNTDHTLTISAMTTVTAMDDGLKIVYSNGSIAYYTYEVLTYATINE